jgi:hypothetical protein
VLKPVTWRLGFFPTSGSWSRKAYIVNKLNHDKKKAIEGMNVMAKKLKLKKKKK